MITDGQIYETKLNCGNYKYPVKIAKRGNRLWFSFAFNKALQAEIKVMEGAKWHGYEEPPIKQWSALDSLRNRFRIEFMEGKNPYAPYDVPLPKYVPRRSLRQHQIDLVGHMISRPGCILGSEMGTGKTLAAIEAIEWLALNEQITSWFFVAPKSALISVRLEFEKWNSLIIPQFHTYDSLKRLLENWPKEAPPPQGVIFDESSRVKTHTSQRSVAAKYLADNIRSSWGSKGRVILMSGSPAPKSPLDWWHQCEIACPGFLREGTYEKFKQRLAIVVEQQTDAGQMFPKILGWKESEKLCEVCGKTADDYNHDSLNMIDKSYHVFKPCINEVGKLHERMKGLVIVKFKKDCLDLPEKQYKTIVCKPTASILNAAKLIAAREVSAVKTLTLLRELSDGFQYESKEIGVETCPACNGERMRLEWSYTGPDDKYDEVQELQLNGQEVPQEYFTQIPSACSYCSGTGEVVKCEKESVQIPCPKVEVLQNILDEHDEIGRLVVYAGFTGSVDRCVETCISQKWDVIRVDGRGWWSNAPDAASDLVKRFQMQRETYPRIVFIGQPGAAGMGLTLTASPTIVYYSNDFNGESRIQSEDRIHRMGMDTNRGATIIDLLHLPTDQYVLDNLKKKRKLQDVTMGEVKSIMESVA